MINTWRKVARASAKTWLYLFIASSLICVFALRHNNQQMVKLREAVYAADRDSGDVNGALNNLRRYVYGHMNTNLSSGNNNIKPPIQLKYTYQRLYEARLDQIQQNNQKIYTEAQNYCQARATGTLVAPVTACVQNYLATHSGYQSANDIQIPAGLYQFDFLSPRW